MNNENTAKYLICEAPVCVGSPTNGTQHAYAQLKENGLGEFFSEKALFRDFEGEREVSETKPDKKLHGLSTVMLVNEQNYRNMLDGHLNGLVPVCLGGDHSLAMSSIAALSDITGPNDIAVIYIDGHTDINTVESSLTGYIHGMPLAQALGLCPKELDIGDNKIHLYGENLYIVGARSIDPEEYVICENQGVHLYTADDIKEQGADSVLNEILKDIGDKKIHLSFDVDSIDGSEFPATGYVMPNGLSFECVYGILKKVIDRGISSLDVVEYNPLLDTNGECREKLFKIFKLLADK
ncbi:MAG: arginase family protein [Oscillospiraceae bacterium]|nr:arginase family protein [Oscillospiraceae bacterium]